MAPRLRRAGVPATIVALLWCASAATAQSALERAPLFPESWVGVPWSLELRAAPIFGRDAGTPGVRADPAVVASLVLPRQMVAEVRFAPQPLETGGRDEIEGAMRATLLRHERGAPADLAVEGRYAIGSHAGTAALTSARWLGPVHAAATAAALIQRDGDPRVALGASAVWHPAPGHLPIALAASGTRFTRLEEDERVAWSAGVQVGVPYTGHTLSLFATSAGQSLPGRLAGGSRTRLGVEFTTHVPLGRVLGFYVPREQARQAVDPQAPADRVVTIPIREYRFSPAAMEIDAGTTVEWVNHDAVIHTASADDGSWGSGAIAHGESWTAVFRRPGIYTYHCGPHPYMRGVIIVRDPDD